MECHYVPALTSPPPLCISALVREIALFSKPTLFFGSCVFSLETPDMGDRWWVGMRPRPGHGEIA